MGVIAKKKKISALFYSLFQYSLSLFLTHTELLFHKPFVYDIHSFPFSLAVPISLKLLSYEGKHTNFIPDSEKDWFGKSSANRFLNFYSGWQINHVDYCYTD